MKRNHSQFTDLRYDARNNLQAGPYRGVGIRGKEGTYKSSKYKSNKSNLERVPPLKFN